MNKIVLGEGRKILLFLILPALVNRVLGVSADCPDKGVLWMKDRDRSRRGWWDRYLPRAFMAGLIISAFSGVAAAQLPEPHIDMNEHWQCLYAPSGALLGCDFSKYITNNGGAGNVFYQVSNLGGNVYGSKMFGMAPGERVEAVTHFSRPPGVTLVLLARPAQPGDEDLGSITIFRLDECTTDDDCDATERCDNGACMPRIPPVPEFPSLAVPVGVLGIVAITVIFLRKK